jgi:hypothetical protein
VQSARTPTKTVYDSTQFQSFRPVIKATPMNV